MSSENEVVRRMDPRDKPGEDDGLREAGMTKKRVMPEMFNRASRLPMSGMTDGGENPEKPCRNKRSREPGLPEGPPFSTPGLFSITLTA